MQRLIELRKLKGSARKPKYATRKLSIGLVSCMLGFTLIVSGTEAKAAKATDTVVSDKSNSTVDTVGEASVENKTEKDDKKVDTTESTDTNESVETDNVIENTSAETSEKVKEEAKKSLADINDPSAISDRKYKSGDAASDYVSGLNSEDVSSISWSSTPSEGDSSASINVTYTDGSSDTVSITFSIDSEEPADEISKTEEKENLNLETEEDASLEAGKSDNTEENKEVTETSDELKFSEEQRKALAEAGISKERIDNLEKSANALKNNPDYFTSLEKFVEDAIAAQNKNERNKEIATREAATREAAAPEDTSTSADAKNAVHGFAGVLVGGDINADLAAETGQRFKPIEGVKVYFQWYEKEGNRTSPTYYAVSGADGQFHIKMKPYIGEDRKLVKFDADTTVSAGNESYKMWVDESTIPEGYQLQYSTGEGVEFTDREVAGGDFNLGPNTLVNYRVLLMKKQDEAKMHKEATPTGEQIYGGLIGQGAVRGKVSWDYESAGGIQWGIVSTPTSPAGGVTVTASYLSDYALKQIYSANTAKMLGLSRPSDIRGSGWTFKLETQLQEWIAEQVAADKKNWIAESVSANTNAEGDYKIQFKGTWGPNRNDHSVAEYTRVAGKYYAGDAHRWTEEEVKRLGTVAENAKDGSFLTGASDWNEKHVNSDWLFISTKDTDDVVKRTPWNYNWYTGSNNDWGIHGGWAQSAFGVSTVQAANSTRADFNFAPAEIKFNITNFDTQANTATPGDVATTKTAGLPHKYASDSYRIVWYDQDGNKVKVEEPKQKPTSTGALAQATYDTTGVTETKTFIAKLHYVDSKGNLGQVLAQDAFTVKIGRIVVSAYDDVNIANPAANDESMKGAAYSAEGLPEVLTIDKNTGTVSGKAKVPGKYTVTVKTSILDKDSGETMEGTSNYTALVTDSPLEHGEVGVEYKKTVKPAEVEGYVFKNVTSKFINGKAIEGLTIENNQITGTPTKEVGATQEGPNVEVTYDIYKLNSKGEEVLIKKGHKDLVPLEITKAASKAPKYEPAYADTDATPGTEVTTEAPKFLDQKSTEATKPEAEPQPTGAKYTLGDGAPTGASVDEKTGKVTYTPTARDANTTVDIPVKVTYSDGTSDETLVKIKVGQAQAESYQPEYTEADAKADTQTTIIAPNFTDKDGQSAAKPEGAKFSLAKDAPTDATINEDTGEITYKPSINQAGQTVNIPVTVTYKDGSTDEVKAPVKVAEANNLNYEPDYKSVVAQVKYPVTVEAPKFLDKDNNEANPQPTGMTFAIEDGFTVNGEIKIDPNTGAITYTAVDADKNTVIEVPVIVTYADGSKESIKAKIDVPSDANFYDPKAKPLTTEQGSVPRAEDGVNIPNNPPEGTTYTWEAVPKVNTPGETTGTVKVTYPDGTEDFVEVPVTVTASASKKTTVDDTNKKPVDPTDQKQGTGIVVTNPDGTTVTAKDNNGKNVPAEINKVTGEIEVTPGTDATDPITVTVIDNDLDGGSKDIEVPVAEKSAQPEVAAPTAGDQTISGKGTPGARVNLALKRVEDIPIANDVAVKDDGTWTADVPAGILLKENDTVVATQKEDGKSVSNPVEAKVAAKAPEVDKKPLQDEVDKEKSTKDTDKYKNADQDKKDAYDKALEDAKKVLEDANASQADVDKAKDALTAAEEALNGEKAPEVDKKPLQDEVAKDPTTKEDVKYTNASEEKKTAYDEALTKANEVLADENATQEQVDAAKQALIDARDALDGEETSAEEYLAVFNGNGGTPTTQKVTVKDGKVVSGVTEPTRDGYKFVKWVKLGTDNAFDLSTPFSKDLLDEDNAVIFTAVWKKVEDEPSEDDNKPSDEDSKPAEDDNKPSNEDSKPTEDDNKPSDEDNKPSDDDKDLESEDDKDDSETKDDSDKDDSSKDDKDADIKDTDDDSDKDNSDKDDSSKDDKGTDSKDTDDDSAKDKGDKDSSDQVADPARGKDDKDSSDQVANPARGQKANDDDIAAARGNREDDKQSPARTSRSNANAAGNNVKTGVESQGIAIATIIASATGLFAIRKKKEDEDK